MTDGAETIEIAGRNVVDLLGTTSFTQALLLAIDGNEPDPDRTRVVDAVLVAMLEHGITPSSLATRLVLDGAPEAFSGAVAAGLLAVGSRFLGTIESSAAFLQRVVETADTPEQLEAAAEAEVARLVAAGERIPGVGHNLHSGDDPRVAVLLDIARESQLDGAHTAAFALLPMVVERRLGRVLVPNAAGAIGAILSDLGYNSEDVLGFALIARCAGLVSHVLDERRRPMARDVWQSLNRVNSDT